jgi:glycosyltransferase involved in cell wall biosynthesis
MKVCFVINSLRGGGAERVMALLCNELVKRGYEITIITYLQENGGYTLDSKITSIGLFKQNEFKNTLKSRILRKIQFNLRLFNILKTENPDIVVSFILGMNGRVIPLAKASGFKIIASEHTSYESKVVKKFKYWIERHLIYKLADKITVLTKLDYENHYSKFLNNVMVMENPLSFFPVDNVKLRNKVILAVGDLERFKRKGFDSLIQVFSKIVRKYPQWRLQIAGGGDDGKQQLIKLAKSLGVLNQIDFLGFQPNVESVMRNASIYVLSSQYEGLPMCLMEAMSQGCACVSYDCVSGPREIINDNVDGILVDDQNIEVLEEKIIQLIKDEDLRLKLAKNAVKSIVRFSTKKIVDKWESLFVEIIGNRN